MIIVKGMVMIMTDYGRLLTTQNDKINKLSIKYLETYLANYSSAELDDNASRNSWHKI